VAGQVRPTNHLALVVQVFGKDSDPVAGPEEGAFDFMRRAVGVPENGVKGLEIVTKDGIVRSADPRGAGHLAVVVDSPGEALRVTGKCRAFLSSASSSMPYGGSVTMIRGLRSPSSLATSSAWVASPHSTRCGFLVPQSHRSPARETGWSGT